jgi:hypothetical protein
MNIRLANYTLRGYHSYIAKHGDRVCPANGCKSVGTITNIAGSGNTWEGKDYTVLWGTGKKRGKTTVHRGHALVLLEPYLEDVSKEYHRIIALKEEASTLGM